MAAQGGLQASAPLRAEKAAAPFQGAAHTTAAVRRSGRLAARLPCPRPGLPGQPEVAGPLAASAMRRPRQRPPAARPRPSLSFPRNRRTGEERERPGRHRPADTAGDSAPSRQAALRQRAPPAQLPTPPPPPGAHRGSTGRAGARAQPASAGGRGGGEEVPIAAAGTAPRTGRLQARQPPRPRERRRGSVPGR